MKTAIVTGGAGGIGSAIVKQLCAAGFSVAINYNSSEEKAAALSSELVCACFDAFPVKADVSSAAQVKSMLQSVYERCGRIDVLVNNAGAELWGLFDETGDADWQRIIGVNLTGAFNCCREVLPFMLKRKYGRIINISSIWGQTGASCEVAYSASKAGLIGLTKALAKEVAPSGITVNCVAPGAIATAMLKRFSAEERADFCSSVPMGRLGLPDEAACAVAFFASERASFITGQILGVNGGLL